jgi:hypothetical protein
MDKEDKEGTKTCDCKDCCKGWHHHHHHGGHGGGGALYGLGIFGAGYYFLQHATTSTEYFWGILKALAWPALIVFKVFSMLHL